MSTHVMSLPPEHRRAAAWAAVARRLIGIMLAGLLAVLVLPAWAAGRETYTAPAPNQGGFTAGPSEARPRVIGGTPADRTAWPSFVLILYRIDAERITICGGTVIAPEWVLTAAHCVHSRDAARFAVYEGVEALPLDGAGLPVREIRVHEGHLRAHPPYRDVALLRLGRRAVSPPQRLISETAAATLLRDGLKATVAGFGATEPQPMQAERGGQVSQRLRQADLPLVERAACRRILARAFGRSLDDVVDETTLCAGDQSGRRDSCQGDSGGALLVEAGSGERVQVGVVSWGPGCAQRDTVGVYAAVGHFEPWIRRHVPGAIFHRVQGGAPQQQPSVAAIEAAAGVFGAEGDRVRVVIPQGARLRAGSLIHVRVDTTVAGTLLVYNVDLVTGQAYQLFPNEYMAGRQPGETVAQIAAGGSVTIPGQSDGFQIRLKPPAGPNRIYAFVLPQTVRTDDIAGRGRSMATLPDAPQLFDDLAARARGAVVEPRDTGGAGGFAYEILP